MNNKRNLLPEYVWMIFVGMLLAIIILMHITPGHAAESSSPSATPIPTSALDPTDACLVVGIHESDYMLFTLTGAEISSLSISELYDQAYFVRYGSAGDSTLFLRDVKIALTQLKSQFQGFFVSILDFGASLNAFNSIYSAISDVGVPISLGYTDFSQNRVLQMVNTNFINAPVWVWNSNIPTPSPSPTPAPQEEYHILMNHTSGSDRTSYMVSFKASGVLLDFNQPLNTTVESVLLETSTSSTILKYNAKVIKTGKYSGSWLGNYYGECVLFYVKCSSFSELKLYKEDSTFGSNDYDFIEANYSSSDLVQGSSSNENNGYNVYYYVSEVDGGYILAFSFKLGEYGYYANFYTSSDIWFQESSFKDSNQVNHSIPFYENSTQYKSALKLMFDTGGSAVPDPNITPTPSPTSTPVPLPTSGESIHVILPSGTPTPTPPFTIQPGEGGGNGSPGSFGGTGLSSGETSGILQAFSMYVSDNPVFAFLGGLFSAFPAKLMYPLYILLFILIILGIIRVFIHFTGG